MRGKNKSFLEDVFIILVVGILIYFVYGFFFSSNEIEEENIPTAIEKTLEPDTKKVEEIKPVIEEIKEEPKKIESPILEPKKEELIQTQIVEPKAKIEQKEVQKPTITTSSEELDEKAKVEEFYKTIRDKINANIAKNVDKNLSKNGEYANIKLTILKDGRYEQLIFVDGDKEYFNLFKPSIIEVFPIKIDDSLKNSFPRYFRMKIEF